MKRADYAYSVAYVRAIENKLLTKSDIESLISAPSVEAALRFLSDKGYGAELTTDNFEKALSESFKKCFAEIKDIAPEGTPLDILLYKNDFHNLKVVLKGVQLGVRDYENYVITPSTTDYETLIKGVAGANFDSFNPMFRDVAKEAYDILGTTGDSQLADVIIDKASMDFCLEKAKMSKNEFLTSYVLLTNTLTDIKTAARCALTEKDELFADMALSKETYLDRQKLVKAAASGINALCEYLASAYNKEAADALKESVAQYEKYADNRINEYMDSSRYVTMGIEPLIAYIHSKESEIQTIRIIISAKHNDIDEAKIRMRLRKVTYHG